MSNHYPTNVYPVTDEHAIRAIVGTMPTTAPIAGRVDDAYWERMEALDVEARAERWAR